ncbi:MAG: putative RNA methyltransferase [Nakamurella sp.]
MTSGLDGALPLLVCPHCGSQLDRPAVAVIGCQAGHRFDIAKQGYLSLLSKVARTDTGDSADMVAARLEFLGAGHYRSIQQAVAAQVQAGPVLEIGAGTGYYLAGALESLTDRPGRQDAVGVALDASRYAARRAANAHPRIGSVVADAWSRLPIGDAVAGTVLSVFAPRNPDEITRVLRGGGRLIAVTPEPAHLAELRGPLRLLAVDAGKPERLAEAFDGRLVLIDRVLVEQQLRLGRPDILALVRMGPSARHLQPDQLAAAVAALPEITTVTLAVTVSVLNRV